MDTLQEIIYIEFSCENLTRLTYYCNFSNGQLYDSSLLSLPLTQLGAPATFFICLLHVLVSLLLAVIVFICFNSVRVLGKNWNITNTSAHTLAGRFTTCLAQTTTASRLLFALGRHFMLRECEFFWKI